MKVRVDLQELQDEADELLDRVERGETIVITELGQPIAKLVPHEPKPSD